MDPTLPWYRSAIIRQQIVAFLVAAFGLFKLETGLDIDATVGALLAGIAAAIPIWTVVTRLFKHSPNMTVTASKKEASMRAAGDLPVLPPTVTPGKQAGFFRTSVAFVLFGISVLCLVLLSGCAVNPHKTAQTVEQQGDAVYGEVTILKEQGARVIQDATVADSIKRPIADAIVAAKPITDGLQDSLILYSSVKTQVAAGTNTAAQLAVVDRELAGWIAQATRIISQLTSALAGARK